MRDLSIIIVNYNVKHFVEQCLHSVINASKKLNVEIFVVDNNSVDGSVPFIKQKFPQVKLIENITNTGFSVANNQGIKQSTGKYVLLLNPDTVVQEDTFEKVITFMNQHPDAGGLGIKMVDGKGNFLPESKRGLPTPAVAFYKIFGLAKLFPRSKKFGQYHLTYLDKDKTNVIDVLSGAFMLLRKETLDKIGLLDETFFMYGEDIDLSYRIALCGYKNYYFADSSIIHYKGESTKKSSVNYVIVFYKAMAIFAQKHFSSGNAKLFNFLIYLAIYMRAAMAIIGRFIKQSFFPAIDFALILCGLFFIKDIYEAQFKFAENYYSERLISFAFPVYTLIWMFLNYLSGGYDKPFRFLKMIRGVLVGTAIILIIYSLLPENYRFSRALILLGTAYTVLVYLVTRVIYNAAGLSQFKFKTEQKSKRIVIIGSEEEFERVYNLLKETRINAGFVGFVSNNDNGVKNQFYIGNFNQINEVVDVHGINEIIFCAKNISSQNIIDKMLTLVTKGVDFKIAPPESLSIIGSNSIDTAGDLYVIDINNVGKPENKRKKRLFDLTTSGLFLIFSPLLIWIQKNKINFISNSFKVLLGIYSWVGYGKAPRKDLPEIKPSVFTPADASKNVLQSDKINLLFLSYSKDYSVEKDIKIVFAALRNLGT
ncbi:MAG TPA: glycosyltransferase [Bacteroidia bacterium]|nr:glycosyltransferase [Bacteroidia bacterium]